MTFAEWFTGITRELEAAGFAWRVQGGFPIVAPATFAEKKRFLDFRSPSGLPVCLTIYAEGALVSPASVDAMRAAADARECKR